ncbi:MAG: hypothetical protein JSS07_05875 [Proteobacteria bacterium]|nr:hypothetical protein [Pseudomonadota bacterium]
MQLQQIFYADRNITSILGMPFYLSTGVNSAYKRTWFPFRGILPINLGLAIKKGWIIKFLNVNIPVEIGKILGDDLCTRFATLSCLLISSRLGTGYWETEKGEKLLVYLKKNYPDFYESAPCFDLLPVEKNYTFNEIDQINNWLAKKANVRSYKQLPTDINVNDLKIHKYVPKLNNLNEILIKNCKNETQLLKILDKMLPPSEIKDEVIVNVSKALKMPETEVYVPNIYGLRRKVNELVNSQLKSEVIQLCENEFDLIETVNKFLDNDKTLSSPKNEIIFNIKIALKTKDQHDWDKIPKNYGLQRKVIDLINHDLKIEFRKLNK